METKEAKFIFHTYLNGCNILQLNNGKILSYYLYNFQIITLYNEKTFKKIYDIDINSIIQQYEKENENEINNNPNKNIIKKLNNGLIIVGHKYYLIELNLHDKAYDYKIIKCSNGSILDINEIADKRIIVITLEGMIILEKENEEYTIKNYYSIKYNWKMISSLFPRDYKPRKFKQFYSIYALPNNRLLLYSSSSHYRSRGCGMYPSIHYFNSKIFFIDLNKFEEIKSTETFSSEVNIFVLETIFIIKFYSDFRIYDINSLEYIKSVILVNIDYIYKYDEQHLIMIQKNEKKNFLVVYKNVNKDLVEYCKFVINFINNDRMYKKILILLKNKKIIIGHNKHYLFKLNFD